MIKYGVVGCLFVALFLGLSGCKTSQTVESVSRFEGDWKVVSMHVNGKPVESAALANHGFGFNQGRFIKTEVTGITAKALQGSITLDSTKSPAEVDLVHTEGDNAGKIQRGIYVFEDDKLKLCYGDLDAPRPTEFTPGDKITLVVLARISP